MDSFLTPSTEYETHTSIKNSRFIAACASVKGRLQAKEFITARARLHPDANDDREPRVSTGKHRLSVLSHSEFGHYV